MTDAPLILLVEDSSSDEELTLRALKKHQVPSRVVVVRDGAEALDYLFARGAHAGRAADELPHVVLLDLGLPKIGGLEVLRQIRADERTRLLPVVILSSSSEVRDLRGGYDSGANSYVVKPVDFRQFAESVRQVGSYWLMLNQSVPTA
jgi:two-component system response regulator